MDRPRLWTVGHGSRSSDELVAFLRGAGIRTLVDVRARPASRRHPWFAREALIARLGTEGIAYVWEGRDLGGRRSLSGWSPHTALAEPGLRAYAQHMGTEAFRQAALRLLALAEAAPTAVLCAESDPARCHRSLLADHFVAVLGIEVVHLLGPGTACPHRLHPGARLERGRLVYDGGTPELPGLDAGMDAGGCPA